ncbi:MAG TPA: molecular chaperone TorD family protein [Pseudobdellovibrionaceae bacterium]|jgi:nitrate reductase assembly molybdenum cofactor insertion protein NarJ
MDVLEQTNPASFVLGSVLMSYPVDSISANIPILLNDIGLEISEDLRALILNFTSPENIQDLQSEYISIFDNGRDINPIYETEYDRRRAMAKGNELSDIAGFYRAFGFELDSTAEGMEILDHVGIELEFYSLMLMKQLYLAETEDQQGMEIVEDGRKKFLTAHLGRFVGAISRRPGVEKSEFYSQIFKWGAQLVEDECKRLHLTVVPADWIDSEVIKEEDMNCSTGGSCLK